MAVGLAHSSPPQRTYALRTSPTRARTAKRYPAFVASSPRPVLVPLHTNLRRLPSRLMVPLKERDTHVQIGCKRKRVASGNENAHTPARSLRGLGRYKRRRATPKDTDDDTDMDVDDAQWHSHTVPEVDSDAAEDDSLNESDDFLLNHASTGKLGRLLRDELIRLCGLIGLEDDIDGRTKAQIVDAIVAVRDGGSSAPVTPATVREDPPSSDLSDGGNDGGGEETDVVHKRASLGRRTTEPAMPDRVFRPMKGRSFSLGYFGSATKTPTRQRPRLDDHRNTAPNGFPLRRHASQTLPSWRSSALEATFPPPATTSPPATRTRQRTTKRNGKQVGFSEQVEEFLTTDDEGAYSNSETVSSHRQVLKLPPAQPSPRRLRSRTKTETPHNSSRRLVPTRRAKSKTASLREDEDGCDQGNDVEEGDAYEEGDAEEIGTDDDLDELQSSPEMSPAPETPARPRLRRRRSPSQSNTSERASSGEATAKRLLRPRRAPPTPPSDGDDEGECEETRDAEAAEEEQDINADDSVDDGEQLEEIEEEEDELANAKVLRNGKAVGEVPAVEDDADAMEESDSVASADEDESEETVDIDEDTDAHMDDDIDLEGATAKTLGRLRRDDLVRMCETRDLEVDGTKPQLVEALLDWRERNSSQTSPSSASTARPPSTAVADNSRGNRAKRPHGKHPTPVLLRSHHEHHDEPRTPPVSSGQRATAIGGNKEEGELELDLESLGLEDREIPPDKLVKLEKIGAGGFKDVFVGKLRGRMKVAIAEFRGQLNAMDIKELKLLSDFDHPNVVRFLGVCIPENIRDSPVAMVSELCANGDLFDYIRNVPVPSLLKVLAIALDIARGLQYLHLRKPSVIHRDCKSSNILITAKGNAKIADFGLAKVKQSTRSMVVSLVGTVNWQAPELWHPHPKYNHKVDVFSCGMVYWEMLQWHIPQKHFPWEGMNEHAIYDIVGAKKQRPSVTGLRKQYCPEIVDLIERMWAHEPQDRPTMVEVVQCLEDTIRFYKS